MANTTPMPRCKTHAQACPRSRTVNFTQSFQRRVARYSTHRACAPCSSYPDNFDHALEDLYRKAGVQALRRTRCAQNDPNLHKAVAVGSTLTLLMMLFPGEVHANETLEPGFFMDAFESWLETVQSLGPLGPALFIITVAAFECIPLFPTQPLSLASGLIFGVVPGACYNLIGVTCAASLAFFISRTIGRNMAQQVIAEETEGQNSGAIATQLAKVKSAIENGTSTQQFTAMTLLRLTPIVPFSASNYVLGLTPVPYAPFLAATVAGMTVWSAVYASVGGAGRKLLRSGFDLEAVMAKVGEQAGDVSEKVAVVALLAGIMAATVFVLQPKDGQDKLGEGDTVHAAQDDKLMGRIKETHRAGRK